MWFFSTKKELKKSLKSSTNKFKKGIDNLLSLTTSNKESIESNKEKIARLEGALGVLLAKNQSHSQVVSKDIKKSPNKIETKLLNRVRRNKKSSIIAEILPLMESHEVIDIFDIIVIEKGLCSKASFYRYINSIKKSQETKAIQK